MAQRQGRVIRRKLPQSGTVPYRADQRTDRKIGLRNVRVNRWRTLSSGRPGPGAGKLLAAGDGHLYGCEQE